MIKLSDELYIPPMGEVLAERARNRAKQQKVKRHFSAAQTSRINSRWTSYPQSMNFTLVSEGRPLRARARQMAANAPHFKNFLNLAKSNVVGSRGIVLQCNALMANGEPNTRINEIVENAFWEWTHRETCTQTGKMNWIAAQRLFIQTLCRDGEVLVQHIKADNPFGYTLKFWNVDYLDETLNEDLKNGNRIIMSVEVNADDKPVAYWLTTPQSESSFIAVSQQRRDSVRIPAEEMTHAFIVDDEETQTRGVTFFAAVLSEGKNLEGYKEGVITSARFAANSFGFLETTVEDETQFEGEETLDSNGNPTRDAISIDSSPLQFNELPPGMKMNQFDPKQPTQNHAEFHWTIVKDIAAGLGLNGFSLAGDMNQVNFSSSRIGLAAERDLWKALQEFVGETLCRDVFHHWLEACILNGRLKLAAREYKELQNPVWQGRGWPYLDPLKDVNASSIAIANGLSTYTDELAVLGIDFEEHLKKKVREQQMMARAGVQLEIVSVGKADAPPEDTQGPDSVPPKKERSNGHEFTHYEN